MGDLIEKIKQKVSDVEAARGPAKHILSDRLADLGQVAWDHWKEIVEALETVRGIEEIMQNETHLSLYRGNFKYEIMSVIIEEMGKLSLKYGSTHEAREIDDPTSVYKNPLKEAEEMFGDRVLTVSVEQESDDVDEME